MAISLLSGSSMINASPESAHSLRVPRGSVSRRLRGTVLMPMVFLAFHNEFVADLPTHDDQNYFIAFHIVHDPKIACAQLELGYGIWTKPLDRSRGRRGSVLEASENRRRQYPTLASRQTSHL